MTDRDCPDPNIQPDGARQVKHAQQFSVFKKPPYSVKGDPQTGSTPLPTVTDQPTLVQTQIPKSTIDTSGTYALKFRDLSVLCHEIGLSPEMVDGIIAQLIVQHFSSPRNILYDELRGYIWDTDITKRKIFIMPVMKWEEINAGRLPAIVYANLGQQLERIAIGDFYYNTKSLVSFDDSFAKLVHGAHRIACVADNEFTASLLASELIQWLTMFSPRIIADLPFHDFRVVQRDAPKTFQALGGKIGIAFTIEYVYTWTWELIPEGPPLKSLGELPTTSF